MKSERIFITFFLTVTLICCGRSTEKKNATREVAIKDLELSEIVHDSLTEAQINNIKKIHAVFSEVNSSSLEENINDFKRDQHPDKEIAIWLKMADAYQRFTSRAGEKMELGKKREAYEVILMRSMMTEADVLENRKPGFITEDEMTEIFSYYQDPPDPLTVKPGNTP